MIRSQIHQNTTQQSIISLKQDKSTKAFSCLLLTLATEYIRLSEAWESITGAKNSSLQFTATINHFQLGISLWGFAAMSLFGPTKASRSSQCNNQPPFDCIYAYTQQSSSASTVIDCFIYEKWTESYALLESLTKM